MSGEHIGKLIDAAAKAGRAVASFDAATERLTASVHGLSPQSVIGGVLGRLPIRIAYQSAVRLAVARQTTFGDVDEQAFDHRALFYRLYGVKVQTLLPSRHAQGPAGDHRFDAGLSAQAGVAYDALLNPSRSFRGRSPRSLDDCLTLYAARFEETMDAAAASWKTNQGLTALGWLGGRPEGRPEGRQRDRIEGGLIRRAALHGLQGPLPVAWDRALARSPQAQRRADLVRLARAYEEAASLIRSMQAALDTGLAWTQRYRDGSIHAALAAYGVFMPFVTQGLALQHLKISDVTFQSAMRALEADGLLVEVTGRKSHRAWAFADAALWPSFPDFAMPTFDLAYRERAAQPYTHQPSQPQGSSFGDLDAALDGIDAALSRTQSEPQ